MGGEATLLAAQLHKNTLRLKSILILIKASAKKLPIHSFKKTKLMLGFDDVKDKSKWMLHLFFFFFLSTCYCKALVNKVVAINISQTR